MGLWTPKDPIVIKDTGHTTTHYTQVYLNKFMALKIGWLCLKAHQKINRSSSWGNIHDINLMYHMRLMARLTFVKIMNTLFKLLE